MSLTFHKHKKNAQTPEQQALLVSLRETKNSLDSVRYYFDTVCAPEMVSSTVYEINALQMRYSYLLSEAKKNNITSL